MAISPKAAAQETDKGHLKTVSPFYKHVYDVNNLLYIWKFSQHVYFTVKCDTRIFVVVIIRMKIIQTFLYILHLTMHMAMKILL